MGHLEREVYSTIRDAPGQKSGLEMEYRDEEMSREEKH